MGLDTPRITTNEAAQILKCSHEQALILLKAAKIPSGRSTRAGAHLWNASAVEGLAKFLEAQKAQVNA